MKSKNIIKIIILTFIFLIMVLVDLILGYTYARFSSSRVYGVSYQYTFLDYYNKAERYSSSNVSFYKYYYEAVDNQDVVKTNYKLVAENDEIIKKNINIALEKFHELDKPIDIDFDYNSITSNDYYSLNFDDGGVRLHYYDEDEHVLYIVSF